MNLYPLVKPCLFAMDAERAHNLTLSTLDKVHALGLGFLSQEKIARDERIFCGLKIPNPVGLAAGLDKDGKHIDALADLGFGFIEIGTVTPKAQAGNPLPRMFRLPEVSGLINRMGFNNDGVDACVARVEQSDFWQSGGILGLNIGKNATTPIESAADDYLICMRKVYDISSYITVNISSPNTKNLRQLQGADELSSLLSAIAEEKKKLSDLHKKEVPLFLKIAPDLDLEQIQTIAELLIKYKIDAVIATNTTIARDTVAHLPYGNEAGGLSGAPVKQSSDHVIKELHRTLQGQLPIIGVGGIMSGQDAKDKINAGASLVQLYSGLIYQGPKLVSDCARALKGDF
jgi:dihydroorotate dehydrogenase